MSAEASILVIFVIGLLTKLQPCRRNRRVRLRRQGCDFVSSPITKLRVVYKMTTLRLRSGWDKVAG